MKLVLALLFCSVVVEICYGQTFSKCQPLTDSGRRMPNVFQGVSEYEMHTEVNLYSTVYENRATFFLKEYYRNITALKKGRVDMYGDNQLQSSFYGQIDKKLIFNNGSVCQVFDYNFSPMDSSGDAFWNFEDESDSYTYGPSAVWIKALRAQTSSMPQGGQPLFWKSSVIRGIKVNLWKACFTLYSSTSMGQNQLTVVYAISDPTKWQDSATATSKAMPVQVSIIGNGTQFSKFGFMNQTYNYVYFEEKIHSETVFQIPSGVGCTGMPAYGFPGFPPIFQFTGELFAQLRQYRGRKYYSIAYTHMTYDYPKKATSLSSERTTLINDFSTGVTYDIQQGYYQGYTYPKCTIHNIADDTSDFALRRKTFGTLAPMMKDPKHFFGLNSTFYYIGTAWTRGIKTDVIETVKFNYTDNLLSQRYYKVVITYYISSLLWSEYMEGDGTTKETGFPVRQQVVAYDESNKQRMNKTMNFFDYSVSDVGAANRWTYYKVGYCFRQHGQYASLMFTFQRLPNDTKVMWTLDDYFEESLRGTLATTLAISPLRLPTMSIDFDPQFVYATVQIVDRAPPMARFTLINKKSPVPAVATQVDVDNRDDCAVKCLGSNTCKELFLCGYGKDVTCYNAQSIVYGPSTQFLKTKCAQYVKSAFAQTLDKTVGDTVQALLDTEAAQPISVVLNIPDVSPKPMTYIAVNIKQLSTTSISTSAMYSMMLTANKYTLQSSAADISAMATNTQHDCSAYCRSNKDCQSISYCFDGTCKLSTFFIDYPGGKNAKYVARDTGCAIYTKPYLSSFAKFPGHVTVESFDKEVQTADTDATCAKACIDESSFDCQTFEYCASTDSCLLYKKSYLSSKSYAKQSLTTKGCSLYKRIAMHGFKFDGFREVSGYSGHGLVDISFDECYKACINDDDGTCNSYDYCPRYSKSGENHLCIIRHTSHPPKTLKVKLDKPLNCTSFQRMSVEHDIFNPHPYQNPAALKGKTKVVGLSSGAMAGLCIGLLAFGLVLGIVILVGFSRYRERRGVPNSGMSISFSKNMDSDS